MLPGVLILLTAYLGLKLLWDVKHPALKVVEAALIGYFAVEILVKWRLSENTRSFLKNHWLKVVLILPVFRVFRALGAAGAAGRAVAPWFRALPYAQKLLKVPLLLKKSVPILLGLLGLLSARDRSRESRSGMPGTTPPKGDGSQEPPQIERGQADVPGSPRSHVSAAGDSDPST